MSIRKKFGNKLKVIRVENGFTQQDLAELADVQPHTIGQIETGRRAPSFDTLEKLSKAMNVDVSEFFEFDEVYNDSKLIKKVNKLISNFDNTSLQYIVANIEQFAKYFQKHNK